MMIFIINLSFMNLFVKRILPISHYSIIPLFHYSNWGEAPKFDKGFALLMVLWTLTILMVIVFSFSYMTRIETRSALSFRHGVEKRFLAEAGIERGIMEIFYRNTYKNQTILLEKESEVWRTDGRSYKIQTDTAYYTVSITDESGKVDINVTPEVILRNILRNLGLEMEEVDTIVDSIMDWKDADDLHRLHGAESDYYMSLPTPYKAKDANFETLEELILVKGISPEILYGDESKRSIIDFLTINSKTGKINLNAAPKEVLLAIPGIFSETADAIIAGRETKELSISDIQGILGQGYSLAAPYINFAGTNTFTIEATGYKSIEHRAKGIGQRAEDMEQETEDIEQSYKGAEETGYAIRATVSIYGNNRYKYVYYKSPMVLKHEPAQSQSVGAEQN